jgi:hypothetical protein
MFEGEMKRNVVVLIAQDSEIRIKTDSCIFRI